MICKICNTKETDSTSGICWECMNKSYIVPIVEPPFDMGEGHSEYNAKTPEDEKTIGEAPKDELTITQVDK